MKKLPVVVRASRVEDRVRGVGHDLGLAHPVDLLAAPGNHRDRRRRDHRARPQRVDADAVAAELLGHAEHAHAHPVFRHRVGDVVAGTIRGSRLSGGDSVRMCGLRPGRRGRLEVRQARLRAQERAAHVDAEHQVEALHRRRQRAGQADRARVVDEDVDAAERVRPLRRPPRAPRPRRGCRRRSAAPVPPRLPRSRAAAVWIVPGSFGCGSTVFAAIATLAPSRAARSAIARPMPREPPVMNSVLPCEHAAHRAIAASVSPRPNCGGRLARNAVMPSTKSAVRRALRRSSRPRPAVARTACAPSDSRTQRLVLRSA